MRAAEPIQGASGLTSEEVRRYHDEGYIAIEAFFDEREVAEMQSAVDEFVDASRSVDRNDDVYDLEPSHTPEDPKLRRLKKPHLRHPAFASAMRNDKLLDLLAQLVGNDIRFRGGKLNMKPPFDGSPVEWHQDWAFYPHTNDDVLAVGIGINDQTEENGCLRVVPGSHKGPILNHHQDGIFLGAVDPVGLAAQAVSLPMRAGGIAIFHVRLLHGSAPNASATPRLLLLYEYAAADAWPLINPDWETQRSEMLRGEFPVAPRMKDLPVRLPFPRDLSAKGSIFEVQKMVRQRGFTSSPIT